MKKFLIILLIVLLIPVSIFAGSFGMSVGATAAYQKAGVLEDISSGGFAKDLSIKDFKFGLDTDLKLIIFDINGKAFISEGVENQPILSGIVSASLMLDFSIARVKAGLGYQYLYDTKSGVFSFGSVSPVQHFKDFKDANFDIYAGVDIVISKVIVGVYGTLPTEVTISKNNWVDLISTVENNWKAAQLGVSISFKLF